ncbi:RING finger protein 32 [Irineochytrium annulatum]|nr:RING finger protein 32 [Irineochytrium annulatum]
MSSDVPVPIALSLRAAALQEHMLQNKRRPSTKSDWKLRGLRGKAVVPLKSRVRLPPIDLFEGVKDDSLAPAATPHLFGEGMGARRSTLAERMGIVPTTEKAVLGPTEWQGIIAAAQERDERMCAICSESLVFGQQILLSCTHTFHHPCLRAFEQHSKRMCPLCRQNDYQIQRTTMARRRGVVDAAIVIQKTWRMSRERRRYVQYRREHPPTNPVLAKKWHLGRLSTVTRRLKVVDDDKRSQISGLFKRVDAEVEESRRILDEALRFYERGYTDWDVMVDVFRKRESHPLDDSCAICLSSLRKRSVDVLSCQHLFHTACMDGLEKFSDDNVRCPICRTADYERRSFEEFWDDE